MGEQGTDLFKVLVWDSLVKFAISRLFAARPFLSWGPVGVIVGWALNLLARDKGLGSAEYLKAREDARKAHFDLVRIRTAS
jgi:hypothetical protein